MTSPDDAARTSRITTNERFHAASELEPSPDAVSAYGPDTRPQPVPMTDPIDDVTKG